MAHAAFILLLTGDEAFGTSLRDLLRESHGHSCRLVPSPAEALDSVRARTPDVVVAELPSATLNELGPLVELLERQGRDTALLLLGPDAPALIAPARLTVQRVERSDDLRRLATTISQAADRAVARREDRLLRESMAGQRPEVLPGLIGVSRALQDVARRIEKAARNKVTVLVTGETGSGKELVAEAIHQLSDRRNKPYKALNCAALNENLLESTLFGHVRGAFTGAIADTRGYFVDADGGTLFLDEIGDLPLPMQPKLFRVLDRREVTPVGATEVRRVDVRVVAATDQNLMQMVEEKKFRDQLYYRLNQYHIHVPALRERREDIPFLVEHFRKEANKQHGLACEGVSSEAMGLLTRYFWPGNVRELRNDIESLVVEVEDRQIEADDLPEKIRGSREIVPASSSAMVGLTMAQVERLMIERTLQHTSGNREQAAKILGIGTRTLYRKIKEYGL